MYTITGNLLYGGDTAIRTLCRCSDINISVTNNVIGSASQSELWLFLPTAHRLTSFTWANNTDLLTGQSFLN